MTDVYFRCAAAGVVCVILSLSLRGKNSEIALVLTLACCCMMALCAVRLIEPGVAFLERISSIGKLDSNLLQILLKIVGIGFIGEITAAICADSGNGAVGKTLQLLSTAVILYLSLPLFSQLLDLVERIMGNL